MAIHGWLAIDTTLSEGRMKMPSIIGALLALLALAWIVRSVIGIRRRQVTLYGRGGFRRTQHGHDAVCAGLLHVGIGLVFFLLGMGLLYVGAARA
jgi:hypothetical protein